MNSSNIKQLMLNFFQRPDVNNLLLQYLSDRNIQYQDLTNDQLIDMLDQLDLLSVLNQQIEIEQGVQKEIARDSVPMDMFEIENNRKSLKIRIEKGRGFKFGDIGKEKGSRFFVSFCGLQQRGRTNSFEIAKSDFVLDQTITFKINPNLLRSNNNSPIELAIVLVHANGTKTLFSIKNIQWRYVLSYGSAAFDIQLAPYRHQGVKELPCVGILSLRLQLSPISKVNMVPQRTINQEFQLQKKTREANNNRFYQYANQFWNDYKSIHRSFQTRRVKIYADSQDKIFVPLCRFIHPLYNIRGIDSPHHALRFCSLIPFQQQQMNRKHVHKRFHTLLAGGQGSIDDHCHLLCSLLLGLGLKAYVCLGHASVGQHTWVITIEKTTVAFWEVTKGAKLDFYSPKTYELYRSVHIVYNHQQFYANTQLDDSITGTKFNLADSTIWKRMDQAFIKPLSHYNTQISLMSPTFNSSQIESDLQYNMCKQIATFRKTNKLQFDHDTILASILSTALANYEVERVTGQTFCQEQFQSAVKNYIPLKHTFKAFPIQLLTLDPKEIMESLKNQPKCRQVILSKGDSLYFAVKVKLVLFPENVFALWLSIAVRYYKMD